MAARHLTDAELMDMIDDDDEGDGDKDSDFLIVTQETENFESLFLKSTPRWDGPVWFFGAQISLFCVEY